MFVLGKKSVETPTFEPWDVLVGLAPSLVEDLAQLVGSTEDDLLVTFQVMTYGDRATLAAYGMIDLDRSPGGRRRVTRVHPAAVELVNLAPEYLAERDDYEVEDAPLLASAAVPWVHVAPDVIGQGGVPVPGVVVGVQGATVLVRVPLLLGATPSHEEDIRISPEHRIGGPGTQVVLSYESIDAPLDRPRSIAIEGAPSEEFADA